MNDLTSLTPKGEKPMTSPAVSMDGSQDGQHRGSEDAAQNNGQMTRKDSKANLPRTYEQAVNRG